MTVKELIKELSAIEDQDRVVILQKDGEGNGYSPLDSADHAWYEPESTWHGECPHPDDIRDGDVVLSDKAVKAVVLYPVN